MKPVPTTPVPENPCRPRHFKPGPCAPAAQEGPARQSLDVSHTRLLITGALFCLAFTIIGLRLVEISGLKAGDTHEMPLAAVPAPPLVSRADILDRNGVLLAATLRTPSLYADPKQIIDPRDATRRLVGVLPDLNEKEIYTRLTSAKTFIWLKRQLTPRQEFAVNSLGIPGLFFKEEEKRLYPKGNVTSHVVGFAGVDDKGLAGVERGLDTMLRGRTKPVELSIDLRIQSILHDEVAQQMASFTATGGSGIVMNVNTGEVLALVSLPDFDPNDPGAATPDSLFNRVTLGTYEMGSVFKIFTVAMALDAHVTSMTNGYDASHPIHIDRFTIHDDHAQNRWLSVPEIFEYSSNIGAAKMALDVGGENQRAFLTKLGMLSEPHFELHELGMPIAPAVWRPINTMTIGFGHGISVSPLQVAIGVSAIVNGGIMRPATLLKIPAGETPPGHQVVSPETSVDMRKLMRLVVERGTGKYAEAPGYVVGGKTGTAEKVSGKRYAAHELLSSFLGVFPVNAPRYLVMVSIDEPHGNAKSFGFATGGWVSAPAVSRTISRMASLVGIAPVDENAPDIVRALEIPPAAPPGRKIAAN